MKDENDVNSVEADRPDSARLYPPPERYNPIRRGSLYDEHTPLTASIAHIYKVTKGDGIFKRHAPIPEHQTMDKRRYYAFHLSYEHNTHECRQLKDDI